MSNKRKKRNVLNARILWLLLFIISAIFFYVLVTTPLLPLKWILFCGLGLCVILILTFLLSSLFYKNFIVKTLDVLLCLVLAIGSILFPRYVDKAMAMFQTVTTTSVNIYMYVLNEDYKVAQGNYFADTSVSLDLDDYKATTFLTTVAYDSDNQNFVLKDLKKRWGSVKTLDNSSPLEQAKELYDGSATALIIAQPFVNLITESEEYKNFLNDTQLIYTWTRTYDTSLGSDISLAKEPFVLFLGGNDEEGELYLNGRTDVNMLVACNPNTHTIALVSLPRDSYIPNPALYDERDKLTHLGLYGIENTLSGIDGFLNLDGVVENYMLVNFTTFRNIIDALGGISIYNDTEFTAIDGDYYPQGQIELTGTYALNYVRERDAFVNGDFTRNLHQQMVLKAMLEKMTSAEMITHFESLLDALKGKFVTNLSSSAIYGLLRKQLDENIDWKIINYHVEGEFDMRYCASVAETPLSVVLNYDNQIEFVHDVIMDILDGKDVNQEDLPDGILSSDYDFTYTNAAYGN